MKLPVKSMLFLAVLAVASPATLWAGGKGRAADLVQPADASPEPTDEEPIVDSGEVVDGDCGHDGVTDDGASGGEEPGAAVCDHTADGGAVEKDGETTVDPVDIGGPEVQRGEDGGLNPEIFQTTSLDGGGAAAPATKVGFGSDERAAEIETKGVRASSVKGQKKGPVALVKKGRVFLR